MTRMIVPKQSNLGVVGNAVLQRPLPNQIVSFNPKQESIDTILEGTFYEIDHAKLPTRSPVMLHNVRAVMVTAKSELNVTVRYPSTQSLEAYFGNLNCMALRQELYPALDEKFIMGPKSALEVLRRKIPSRDFEELRHSIAFWLVKSSSKLNQLTLPGESYGTESKQGPCFSKLESSGIKGWGLTKKVAYLPNSEELKDHSAMNSLTFVEKNACVKTEEDDETNVQKVIQYSRKRKRGRPPHSESKKRKAISKLDAIEVKPKIIANIKNEYVERWTLQRYETAATELLEVLKNNGAVHGNPMSRTKLRTEARKRIGDTGLLDHLLKHLAGKVVPRDGTDRVRRRCDADGKMQYWVENADLVNIRKKAGVEDPYWIPPPGWKLGDNINIPSCMCRQEVKMLKEELSILRSQLAELKCNNVNELPITAVMPDFTATSSGRVRDGNLSKKEILEVLKMKKSRLDEQEHQLSKLLIELEEDMKMQPYTAEAAANQELKEAFEDIAGGELSDSYYGEEQEKESQDKKVIVNLRPCRHQDNIDNTSLCEAIDDSVQDFMAPTSASGSPLSTTTS
ncbi:protein DYAD-like isoform X2 [Amaranthus tricolor]|nr:protein DYAD-like isoform X2 [Amaranthus tricolor]